MKKRLCIFFGFIILSTTACSSQVPNKTSINNETATPTDSKVVIVDVTPEPTETTKPEAIEKKEIPTSEPTPTPTPIEKVQETKVPPTKTDKPVEPTVVETPTTPKPAELTVVETPTTPKPVEQPVVQKPTIETAQKYVGASVQSLLKALGQPNSKSYAPSCIGDGDDGELHYDGFVVYTYKEGTTETVSTIESN